MIAARPGHWQRLDCDGLAVRQRRAEAACRWQRGLTPSPPPSLFLIPPHSVILIPRPHGSALGAGGGAGGSAAARARPHALSARHGRLRRQRPQPQVSQPLPHTLRHLHSCCAVTLNRVLALCTEERQHVWRARGASRAGLPARRVDCTRTVAGWDLGMEQRMWCRRKLPTRVADAVQREACSASQPWESAREAAVCAALKGLAAGVRETQKQ